MTTSPSASAARIALDDTPSISGATRIAKPSRSSSARSPERLFPKRKSSPGDDDLAADGAQVVLGELLRAQLLELRREAGHDRRLDSGFLQQLQAALERRQEVHPIPEGDPRMRVERDHCRGEPGRRRRADDGSVPAVHAVERADGDGPWPVLDVARSGGDLHASSLASACSGGMIVSVSASSTENGPISVRRSVRQCPPSASAIERT